MAVLMGAVKSKFDNFTTTFSFLYAIQYIATKKIGNSKQIEIKKSISKKLNLNPNASYGAYAYKLYNELVKIGAKSSSDAALKQYDLKIDNQKRIITKK